MVLVASPVPAFADAVVDADTSVIASANAPSHLAGNPTPDMPDVPQGGQRHDLTVLFGTTYWTGRFGTPTDTDMVTGLFSVRYRTDRLRLTATLPLMRIDSDALVFTGIDGAPLVVEPKRNMLPHRRDGLGDLTLGASYALPALSTLGLELEMQARIKLPTASNASGLSTGRTDASVGLDAYRPTGPVTPYASVRYRVFGDPNGWTIRDGFSITAGAIVGIAGATYGVVSYSYAESTGDLIGDAHQLQAAVSTPVSDGLRLTVLGSAGLSSGAPDLSVGASLSFRF